MTDKDLHQRLHGQGDEHGNHDVEDDELHFAPRLEEEPGQIDRNAGV
jgi:hypothetical protein